MDTELTTATRTHLTFL